MEESEFKIKLLDFIDKEINFDSLLKVFSEEVKDLKKEFVVDFINDFEEKCSKEKEDLKVEDIVDSKYLENENIDKSFIEKVKKMEELLFEQDKKLFEQDKKFDVVSSKVDEN